MDKVAEKSDFNVAFIVMFRQGIPFTLMNWPIFKLLDQVNDCSAACIVSGGALSFCQLMRENENPMRTEATKKLFTVDEYYKIVESGVFPERVHTELIDRFAPPCR